jgi:PAS domain S-box-containing protein
MRVALDKLRIILGIAEIGVWQMHVPTGEIMRNDVFPRMLQLTPEELADDSTIWMHRIHAADRAEFSNKRKRILAGECDAYSIDYRVQRSDGSWASLRGHTAVAEKAADGTPLWICGLLMDISRERDLESRLQAVFGRPFQFMGLLAPDGRVVETIRSLSGDSGYRFEESLGNPYWEGSTFAGLPELQRQLKSDIERAAAGELVRFEMNHADRDGFPRTTDFTLTPLRDDNDNVANLIVEGRDISELARAREAGRAAEESLKTATEAGNIGLWNSHIPSGRMWMSDQWWVMLGYRPDELPKSIETLRDLVHPEDRSRFLQRLQDCTNIQQGIPAALDMEYRMLCKDGSWRWIHGKGRIVEWAPSGAAIRITGVHIDVTDRREAESRLAAAERLESIGRLAAGVAHEINTPVQYVSDSVYFVREAVQDLLARCDELASTSPAIAPSEDIAYLREHLPEALDRATDGLARVAEIVRSMKEFSHADQSAMSPIDLNRAIQSTLVVARSEYKYVAELVTDFGDIPPVICHGGQINQVVLNLIVNAAHAIADRNKSTNAKGEITVRTRLMAGEVVISISDTGTGIPESIRNRIFEPFFTTKEVGRGTGQGLSMAHNTVVQGHGGTLSFQTEAGEGTTFFVQLPVEPDRCPSTVAA